jgi:hypothetical protein
VDPMVPVAPKIATRPTICSPIGFGRRIVGGVQIFARTNGPRWCLQRTSRLSRGRGFGRVGAGQSGDRAVGAHPGLPPATGRDDAARKTNRPPAVPQGACQPLRRAGRQALATCGRPPRASRPSTASGIAPCSYANFDPARGHLASPPVPRRPDSSKGSRFRLLPIPQNGVNICTQLPSAERLTSFSPPQFTSTRSPDGPCDQAGTPPSRRVRMAGARAG